MVQWIGNDYRSLFIANSVVTEGHDGCRWFDKPSMFLSQERQHTFAKTKKKQIFILIDISPLLLAVAFAVAAAAAAAAIDFA